MNELIKYVRVEGNKVIIVPRKDGIELLKKNSRLVEDEEVVGKATLIAYTVTLKGKLKYFHVQQNFINNLTSIHAFTEEGDIFKLEIPVSK